jgi:hypothetical protein
MVTGWAGSVSSRIRFSLSWSRLVTRSCWRRCSSQDATPGRARYSMLTSTGDRAADRVAALEHHQVERHARALTHPGEMAWGPLGWSDQFRLKVLPGRRGQRLPGADREHQRQQPATGSHMATYGNRPDIGFNHLTERPATSRKARALPGGDEAAVDRDVRAGHVRHRASRRSEPAPHPCQSDPQARYRLSLHGPPATHATPGPRPVPVPRRGRAIAHPREHQPARADHMADAIRDCGQLVATVVPSPAGSVRPHAAAIPSALTSSVPEMYLVFRPWSWLYGRTLTP